ncbi:putative Aldehyde dehydrogenase, mitochondrial [Glarea lozoyensis 74030]|uniref:aldehyde dehydrogenase (NAD(+)) n=1 Tax=Glarea lozoyensis (strain ATCC 74030 / MF5533) TaxID=1104152 RepID=H0ELL3_GLAL7|nr:putative Aldehyde dehydrogenase, mitochondrial [Glarea lozoyensis 74030]
MGVGVGIVPWNFPMLLATIKLTSALLAGNTFILKPSPFSPYTALKLGEVGAQVFPKGVLNVLSGEEDLGPMLTAHPGVAKVATLSFFHTGQLCVAIKRIYVHSSIYDAFLAAFTSFVSTLKIGNASDPEATLGPIQNKMQYEKLLDMHSEISKQGLKVALGADLSTDKKGFFLPPTVIDNPPDDARIVTEEQFGPIIPLLKWTDEEDVLRRANDSLMGLGGSVWGKDVKNAER